MVTHTSDSNQIPSQNKRKSKLPMLNKANLRDLIAATVLVISNWIQIVNFSARVTVKFNGCPRKTIGHFFIRRQALCINLNPLVNSNWIYSPETFNSGRIGVMLSCVTLKFDEWPWKTIGHLFYATSSFVQHFVAIGEFKLELQSGNTQPWSNSTIFSAVWPWNLTNDLENNRAPLLSNIKLYVSFHHHVLIQTGVTVRKRLSWVVTSVTLIFDLWPWPFAWTLP